MSQKVFSVLVKTLAWIEGVAGGDMGRGIPFQKSSKETGKGVFFTSFIERAVTLANILIHLDVFLLHDAKGSKGGCIFALIL